ncbi:MAG TPA: ClbS/DfsB family four-helix bundle protein [Anaerolineales bacterium]
MNKKEIITALEESREDFLDLIEGLPGEDMLATVFDNWSLKDVLAHLTMWEAELVKLMFQAQQGRKPTTVHFTSESVDERNAKWYRQNKDRPLDRILDDFHGVRNQTIRRVESFSERDLTDPNRYPWLDGTPLWRWIADDSFEHEAEHMAHIRAWRQK